MQLKLKLRKDKENRVLDADGSPIVAFLSHNEETGKWDFPHFLGEPETIDERGEFYPEFKESLPSEEYFGNAVLRSALEKKLNSFQLSSLNIIQKCEDELIIGTVRKGDELFRFGMEFGDSFESDDIFIEKCNTEEK